MENNKKGIIILIVCVVLVVVGAIIYQKSKTINTYVIKENDKTHEVKYELVEESEDERYANIYYKDNKIKEIELGPVRDILDVYQMKDIVIYSIINSDASRSVEILDKEGNTLKKFHDFDDGMNLVSENYMTINNGTITFITDQYAFSCDIEDYKDVNLVHAKYELKYLGNNKLSDLKMLENKTRNELCE